MSGRERGTCHTGSVLDGAVAARAGGAAGGGTGLLARSHPLGQARRDEGANARTDRSRGTPGRRGAVAPVLYLPRPS